MAKMLLAENCTVTMAHSHTANLAQVLQTADILVAAVGRPGYVKADWVKEGAIVLDVGINRMTGLDGATALCGDVDFQGVLSKVKAITPVPGGVGPMTVACLLQNTYQACLAQQNTA